MASGFLNNPIGKLVAKKADEESGKDSLCPSLSLKHRIIGYAVTVIIGTYIDLHSIIYDLIISNELALNNII
jgi:hypothetical protein